MIHNFKEIFVDDTKNVERVSSKEYWENGKIAIIDQGKDLIVGYTDCENYKICKEERIIFGDHTRIFKYINIPFITGADGTKVLKLIDTNKYNYKYFYYYLLHTYIPNTGYNRHFKWVRELKFNIPKIEKQIEIANKLDKVQDIIDLRKKQIEELDELIKSQFVEMFGEPLTSNNYGRITLDKIVKVNQGLQIPVSQRFNEDGENRYKYITIQYLNGGKQTEYIENPNARVICTKDDILMTRTGNTGQVITNVEGVFHNNFFKVDYDKKRLNKEFLIKYFEDDGIYKDMLRRATTSTIPDLSHSEFYKMSIDLPPIELQNQFAEIVKQINNQKFILEKSLKETEELQESLMNKYFG